MTNPHLRGTLLLAFAGCFTVSTAGAEPGISAASPYQLTVGHEPFRLAVPGKAPQASRAEPATPAALSAKPYAALIHSAARDAALEPALVHAVIAIESGYNPAARSHKGAIGLMQVMPDTARRYGVKDPAKSPEANLKAGTRYLKDLMQQFGDRLELVLAAYNAGEHAVLRHGGRIPPYRETERYVPAVLAKYRELQEAPVVMPVARFEYLHGTRLAPWRTGSFVE